MPIRGHAQIVNKITLINKMLLPVNVKRCVMLMFKILNIKIIYIFFQLCSLYAIRKIEEYGCISRKLNLDFLSLFFFSQF